MTEPTVPQEPNESVPARPWSGTPAQNKKKKRKISLLIELPILVLVALVVAILIKTFLVQAFWIPSGSMIHTLEINDRVLVNKLSYLFGEPEAGDVVVFDPPFGVEDKAEPLLQAIVRNVAESLGLQTPAVEDLIKRVIAVGGQELEVKDNQVLIDGVPLDEPYLDESAFMPDFGPVQVPEGTVFVMGDNRTRSQDSRRFGPIDADSIVGRAFVRVWPFGRWGGL
jgi:signal peptidase I